MPKACIYAGFRHLFYRMALVWLYLWREKDFSSVFNGKIITPDIDADSIVEMIYIDSANEG